jgi:hypothetical protein
MSSKEPDAYVLIGDQKYVIQSRPYSTSLRVVGLLPEDMPEDVIFVYEIVPGRISRRWKAHGVMKMDANTFQYRRAVEIA